MGIQSQAAVRAFASAVRCWTVALLGVGRKSSLRSQYPLWCGDFSVGIGLLPDLWLLGAHPGWGDGDARPRRPNEWRGRLLYDLSPGVEQPLPPPPLCCRRTAVPPVPPP